MWVTAYTDASVRNGKATWAIWLRCERGRVIKAGVCPEITNNVAAEVYAAYMALTHALATWEGVEGIQINSDCQTVVQFKRWPMSKNAEIRCEELRFRSAASAIRVTTKWIKGHQASNKGVRQYLNNQVDKLAAKEHWHE